MRNPRYLNTDLEIDSTTDLTPLVTEFGEDVVLIYNGEWGVNYRCSFEVTEHLVMANEALSYFCALVEALPEDIRKIWDQGMKKEFSVGFESGNSSESYELEISNEVLRRVARIGARVSIVIYPAREENAS